MREVIEKNTGIPVVSITYDGTGGLKNEVIFPYLKYPRNAVGNNTCMERSKLG